MNSYYILSVTNLSNQNCRVQPVRQQSIGRAKRLLSIDSVLGKSLIVMRKKEGEKIGFFQRF